MLFHNPDNKYVVAHAILLPQIIISVSKELQQIHVIETYVPMDSKKLTRADRLKPPSALIFLVENNMPCSKRGNARSDAGRALLKGKE